MYSYLFIILCVVVITMIFAGASASMLMPLFPSHEERMQIVRFGPPTYDFWGNNYYPLDSRSRYFSNPF